MPAAPPLARRVGRLVLTLLAAQSLALSVAGPSHAATPVRINVGGAAYTSSAGLGFAADGSFSGGTVAAGGGAIAGTSDPALYQDERRGDFRYTIPVDNGTYEVRLHFVELDGDPAAPAGPGTRVFGIDLLDTPASPDVADLDVYAEAGARTALVKTIADVTVNDGSLDLVSVRGAAGEPELAAVEILPTAPPPPVTCPCSLFSTVDAPVDASNATRDGRSDLGPWTYELGVRVRLDAQVLVRSLRFYKSPLETGAHTARIWTAAGIEVAHLRFENETSSGWQEQAFRSPPQLEPGSYVVSVNANEAFPVTRGGLEQPIVAGPLRTVADGGNGVYADAAGYFPTASYGASNYFVDLQVAPPPPTVVARAPADGATAVPATTTVSVTFSRALVERTIDAGSFTLTTTAGVAVAATVAYDAAQRRATLTPVAPLAASTVYQVNLRPSITAENGATLAGPFTWSFTTAAPPISINVGGGAVTSSDGVPFSADRAFSGGAVYTTTQPIAGTADPALYQNERYGQFSYAIAVPNGTYDVRLHFVELYYGTAVPGGPGKRDFGIDLLDTAGSPDIKDLDVYAQVGARTALVKTIAGVTVSDGTLDLRSVYGAADDPELAAIEILPAPPPLVDQAGPDPRCPCSLFGAGDAPSRPNNPTRDGRPEPGPWSYELGVRVQLDEPVSVRALRFYKSPLETGAHTGRIWTAAGIEVAHVAFGGETAGGWQEQAFASPPQLEPGAYVVSVNVNDFFPVTRGGLDQPIVAGPLRSLADGNGVYAPTAGDFPAGSYAASNYFVDLEVAPTPPAVVAPSPVDGAGGVASTTTVGAGFSRALAPGTIGAGSFTLSTAGGAAVQATVAYDSAARRATLTPVAPLAPATTYQARLAPSIAASDGTALAGPVSWSFTTAAAPVRINAGGGAYTTATGESYAADRSFTGGSVYSTTQPIAGTGDPALYQNERWGQFSYAIAVPSGTYDVRLHFVELYYGAPGKRIFGIDVLDTPASPDIDKLDIYAQVGARTALVKTIAGVTVSDGTLDIRSVYGTADDPELAAIEILPAGPTQVDSGPPAVSLTAPAGGSTLSGATTVSASASDDVGVVGVQFKLDGTDLGPEQRSAPYSVSWNTATVADGSHVLTAVARDAAGNTTTSAAVTVTTANAAGGGDGSGDMLKRVVVGPGFVDASVRVVVRTAADVVYVVAADDTAQKLGTGPGVIRAWKANRPGIPTAFAEVDAANRPTAAGTGVLGSPDVRIDSAGTVHVLYVNKATRELVYGRFSTVTDTWGATEVVATNVNTGTHPFKRGETSNALVLDAGETPHIVYTTGSSIVYRNRVGGSWSAPQVIATGTSPVDPQLAVAPNGDLHLAWLDDGASPAIRYARQLGGTWAPAEVVAATDVLGDSNLDQGPSIVVTQSGVPYIVYVSALPVSAVRVRYRSASGWIADDPPTNLYVHTPDIYAKGDDIYVFLGHDIEVRFGYVYRVAGQPWSSYLPLTTVAQGRLDGAASVRWDPARETNAGVIDAAFYDEDTKDDNAFIPEVYYMAVAPQP